MVARVVGFHRGKNLGVVQFGTSDQNSFQYISSGKAIKEKLVEIREVSESGSVNALSVVNFSDEFVFLMDGDILAGAKENHRVLNTSMLLAPHSKTRIPVSCLERGRWSRGSDIFDPTEVSAPGSFRGEKAREVNANRKLHTGFPAPQEARWDRVQCLHAANIVSTPSENLSDLFAARHTQIEAILSGFAGEERANGLAVFLGRRLSSIDIFNGAEVCAEYLVKLVRGAAFEALSLEGERITKAEAEYHTLALLDTLESLTYEEYPAIGVGTVKRFESPGLAGFRLKYGAHLIHMTALATAARGAA